MTPESTELRLPRIPALVSGDRLLELFTTVARVEGKLDHLLQAKSETRAEVAGLLHRVETLEAGLAEIKLLRRWAVAIIAGAGAAIGWAAPHIINILKMGGQ